MSNFWITLETLLVICEINLILTWSADCVTKATNRAAKFVIIDTKLYVPVVILSSKDKAKPLQQLKSGLKEQLTIYIIATIERQNQYLDYLIDPSHHGVLFYHLKTMWLE